MLNNTLNIWKERFNLLFGINQKVVRKKNRILAGIIALMGLSLIGMCAVQIFWIRQAAQIHNEQFKTQVNEALMSVANRLQMIETTSIIVEASAKADAIEKGDLNTYVEPDPQPKSKPEIPAHPVGYRPGGEQVNTQTGGNPICSNKFFVTSALESKRCSIMIKSGHGKITPKSSVDNCRKNAGQVRSVFRQMIISEKNHNGRFSRLPEAYLADYPTDHFYTHQNRHFQTVSLPLGRQFSAKDSAVIRNNEKIEQKAALLEDVIKELTVINRPIQQRVNLCTLDSLIHVELKNYGIGREFVYGIVSKDSVIASAEMTHEDARKSDFKVRLFPYDLNNANYHLILNFSDPNPSFWQYNWGVVSLAGLFLSLIIVCFGYTVYTIHNQKKLSQMKQDFISNMTHEFKTPITTISLISETLAGVNEHTKPEKIKKFASIIAQENKRLEDQVVRVLQMAEIERKEIKLHLDEIDVNDTIADAVHNVSIQAESRGGKITIDFCVENPVIVADTLHFTNIVTNLLDNANKYSPQPPDIAVRTTCNDSGVTVSISDKGLGMTQEQIRHIFEKFYRVPTGDRHDIKGFGLGLAYVKSLVEVHGGNIRVESKPNVGSRFDVFFPYQPPNVA